MVLWDVGLCWVKTGIVVGESLTYGLVGGAAGGDGALGATVPGIGGV